MSARKYPSGYEILLKKKKRQKEELIESQKGAMDKFITSKKTKFCRKFEWRFHKWLRNSSKWVRR